MEIISSHIYHEVELGESFFQFNVISMWDVIPSDIFRCYSSIKDNVITYTVNKMTKIGDGHHSFKPLLKSEITDEMKSYIREKGYSFS